MDLNWIYYLIAFKANDLMRKVKMWNDLAQYLGLCQKKTSLTF